MPGYRSTLEQEVERLRGQVESADVWLRNRATAAHALGQTAEERVCLDVLIVMERAALAEPVEQEAGGAPAVDCPHL